MVDQARIDRFAVATGDHQFVHVDPVRAAAETPFGGTVAHGYLTLSMIGGILGDVLPVEPLSPHRQGLGMPQPKGPGLPPLGIRPPHDPKALPDRTMISDRI